MNLSERIATARGMRKAHLVVKNARIFHLTTGEFELADIAIDSEGLIVGVGEAIPATWSWTPLA